MTALAMMHYFARLVMLHIVAGIDGIKLYENKRTQAKIKGNFLLAAYDTKQVVVLKPYLMR